MQVFSTKSSKAAIAFLAGLYAVCAGGQVRIQAHRGMDVPKEEVNHLFHMTCRVVAEEFRLGDASEVQVPISLILGESRDGLVGDETNQVFTIYMSRWDETMFATAVSRIALQHLVSKDRKARIVRESIRRAQVVAPVSIDALAPHRHRVTLGDTQAAAAFPRGSPNPPQSGFSSTSLSPAESDDRVLSRSDSLCQP